MDIHITCSIISKYEGGKIYRKMPGGISKHFHNFIFGERYCLNGAKSANFLPNNLKTACSNNKTSILTTEPDIVFANRLVKVFTLSCQSIFPLGYVVHEQL